MAMAARYLILERKAGRPRWRFEEGRGHFLHGETLGLNPGMLKQEKWYIDIADMARLVGKFRQIS